MDVGEQGDVRIKLTLDGADFIANQRLLAQSSSSAARTIESHFKELGIKSSAEMDDMRRKITNSFDMISTSAKSTANDIIRAERAKNDQLRRLDDEQFGKHTSHLDSLKQNYLKATIAITAAVAGIAVAWRLAKEGADFSEQQGMLDNLARKYDSTANQIVASMRKASDGMIADVDLMSVALGGLAKKLSPQQLIDMADAARILGDTVGKDATTALNELSMALETGKTKALKGYLGTTIDLEAAFGNLYERLTEAEKAQALYAITMIETRKLQAEMTTAVDDAADKLERVDAQFKNIKTSMAQFFKAAVVGFYDLAKAAIDASSATSAAESGNMAASTIPQSAAPSSATAQKGSATKQYEDQIAALKRLLNARKDNEKAGQDAEAMSKRLAVAAEREAKTWHDLADEIQIAQLEAAERAGEQEIKSWESLYEEIGYAQLEAAEKAGETELAFWSDLYGEIFAARYDAAEEEGERELAFWTDLYNEIADRELDAAERAAARRGRLVEEGFSDLAYAMDGISRLYEEGSTSAKKWEEASRAMEVAQRAVAVVNAVATIANQGLGDPYTAFARIAAMAAAMGALLATIGESVGGTSASSSASASSYKSTALGSSESSQSIANTYELLNDTYSMEYDKLSGILDEIKSLNQNISGLVANVVRYGSDSGLWASSAFGSSSIGSAESSWNKYGNQFVGFGAADPARTLGIFNQYDPLGEWVTELFGSVVDKIFGGSSETSLSRAGIEAGGATVAGLLSGQGFGVLRSFAETKTETEGGWFGSDSTDWAVYYDALDKQTSTLFTNIFKSLSKSLEMLGGELGADASAILEYGFNSIVIDLKDMDAEEISEAISAKISEISDNAAEALFGGIVSQYQQVGEGLYETAVRLVKDKAVVLDTLEMTRQSYSDVISEQIALSESLINFAGDLDTLREAAESFFSNFYSEAEQQAYIETSMTKALANYGKQLPKTREEYRALVEEAGLLATEAGQKTYVALLSMSESADAYYSHVEDLAKTSFGMQLELLEAEGKTAEATAISRYAELLAMDESLRPMQQRIWALQDEAAAADAATEAYQKQQDRGEAYLSWLEYMVDKEEELKKATEEKRQESIRNSNAVNSAIRSRITTVDTEGIDSVLADVLTRAEEYWDTLDDPVQTIIDNMTESIDNLASAQEKLLDASEKLTGYTYEQAQAKLNEILMEAQGGDFSNVSSISGLVDVIADSSKYFSTAQDYNRALMDSYNQVGTIQSLIKSQSSALTSLVANAVKSYTYTDATGATYGALQYTDASKSTSSILAALAAVSGSAETSDAIKSYLKGIGISGYASGGYPSEGAFIAGEDGSELIRYGGASRVYNNSDTKKILGSEETTKELKELRKEMTASNALLAKYIKKLDDHYDMWDSEGLKTTA